MDRPAPPQLDLGGVRLRWLNGGTFRLDGAAIFGQLPRPVWSRLLAPDEDNRVGLAAHVLLVETRNEVGLIEAGIPPTLTPRQQAFLEVEQPGSVTADLAGLGISPDDIRWVILTHLHPDHAGGVLVQTDGARAPLFPNARHVVQQREVETVQDPEYPWQRTLDAEGFRVLLAAGLVQRVDGAATVGTGIRVVHTGGHTPGHQMVILEGADATASYLGDLLPTRYHLDPVCVPAVDDFPLESIAAKRVELARAGELGTWLVLAHDREVLAVQCRPDRTVVSEVRAAAES